MKHYTQIKKKCLSLGLLTFLSLALFSCKKDKADNIELSATEGANTWVLDSMRAYYYWNQSLPSKPDFRLETPEFFESIRNTADRFSWIQKAEVLEKSLNGITKDAGFDFYLLRKSSSSDDVVGLIRIVAGNSPASQAGLTRGNYFTKVNGTTITRLNYETVIAPIFNGEPYNITLAAVENNQLVDKQTISLTPVELHENPIHAATILTSRTGKKVGYLFYNQFLPEYNNDLLNAFNNFKSNGVTQLIVDLRYNPGGSVASAALLAGLIQPSFNGTDVFIQFQGNTNLGNESYRYSDIFSSANINLIKSANLNLTTVYVLATGSSASASELLINNLRPFMNVVHIGEATVGKNEASITIRDQRSPALIDWAIQPIVFKTANKNGFGDYANGLDPQAADMIRELDYQFSPIGSATDPLIARALNRIDPATATVSAIGKPSVLGAPLPYIFRRNPVMTVDEIKLK